MAIDQVPYRDTEELVNVKSRRFWPAQIPISHWQLRHFISNPEPNHLYYATGPEVFCLNTVTKQHRLIATLPFDARCTASGYGWVCVGGEKEGHYFAAIKLDSSGPRTLDVDAALPLDAWRGARRSPSVRVERVGGEIVNSISIHRIQDEEAHLDDIVAVLTNNDKTVRVFSLPQNTEAHTIELPHPVNHATISPDGKLMVVVGDYAQAFFFSRQVKSPPPQIPKPHNRLTSAHVQWKLIKTYDLYVTNAKAPQGYFTTAWSPDGHLVALGSEDGYISVFNAEKVVIPEVDVSDAIVTVIPSSRAAQANPHPGAVRTMMFSPAPWDLLVWAEDQDRVCVSDLRTGLRTKQVLVLDPKDKTLEHVADSEIVREGTRTPSDSFDRLFSEADREFLNEETEILRRHRDRRLANYQNGLLNLESERPTTSMRGAYRDEAQGLTAREQHILDTLRESRQRQEARYSAGALGVTYTTPDLLAPYTTRTRTTATDTSDAPELVRTSSNPSRSTPAQASGSSSTISRFDRWEPLSDDIVVYNPPRARTTASSSLRRTTSSQEAEPSALPRVISTADDETSAIARTMSALRARGSSNFLPTPPSSQPSASLTAADATADAASRADTHRNDDDEDPDEVDDSDDEDVWRNIDSEISTTRGPLFEYAARGTLASSSDTRTNDPSTYRAEAARQEREFRQRYLIRQRERLREREEAAAYLSRANDYAALPTLSRTRALDASDGYEALLRRRIPGYGHDVGVRTAGLAMSDDGSTLWAACEDGIFEFQMNQKARMFWPAIEPR